MVWEQVGDLVVVDGGMVSLEVKQKFGPDVRVEVVDPGIVLSRANLTFRRGGRLLRARNSMLPVLSSKARPALPPRFLLGAGLGVRRSGWEPGSAVPCMRRS